jgi:hypothetical protein
MGKIISNKIFMVMVLACAMLYVGSHIDKLIAEEMCIETGIITLRAPESVETKRSEVDFPHGVHFGYSCTSCHHNWTGTEPIQSCQASGCHDLAATPRDKKGKEQDAIRYYKTAYHELCIGCHKEIDAKNKAMAMSAQASGEKLADAGPTGCVVCHPK